MRARARPRLSVGHGPGLGVRLWNWGTQRREDTASTSPPLSPIRAARQLVWGEAANLRHAPEMLTCVFHCAANAVKLPPETPPLRPGSTALYLLPGSTMPYPPCDFLQSVVRPVYLFLRRETLERREEPVGERVMYDDVNEFFW